MSSYLAVAMMSVLITLGLNQFIRSRIVVVIVAALLTAAVFQAFVYFDLKYLDPFILIAFAFSSLLAAGVSAVTVFLVRRRRPARDAPDQS